jgi:D-amino-acid oxidase
MASSAGINVLIIGAGVSGLTTAVCLAEAGMAVRVLTKQPPSETTSAMAGASWGPYMVTDSRILQWSTVTLAALERIAVEEPDSGVRLTPGLEVSIELTEPPDWARQVRGYRPCHPGERPQPERYTTGWVYTIPLVDMPRYLRYLERRLNAAGTVIELVTVHSFAEVADLAPVVVNCAGLGARELADDGDLYPIRGQILVVENPGIDRFFQDDAEGELTYFLPHGDHVVLGGSAVTGSEDLAVDEEATAAIIKRCAEIEPLLRNAKVIKPRVGLRPTRPRVRVEREEADGYTLIHNYGHGGGGLTLSWGCARDVLALVDQTIPDAAAA